MRAILLGLLLLSLSCAKTIPGPAPEDVPSMQLIGRYGIAHACPVEGNIITAAHVAQVTMPDGRQALAEYLYQQGRKSGVLHAEFALKNSDMAVLHYESGQLPAYQIIADGVPAVGEPVFWYEYVYRNGVVVVRRSGKVRSYFAGHITFSPAPTPGASGGCLVDAAGLVVGIVSWRMGEPTDGSVIATTGVAPALVPPWNPPPAMLDNHP